MAERVQLSRKKGWKLPPLTVKVDRSTRWGNPYRVGEPVDMKQARRWGWKMKQPERSCDTAEHAVRLFGASLAFDDASKWVLRQELRGKNLACWCALDQLCHADILMLYANA